MKVTNKFMDNLNKALIYSEFGPPEKVLEISKLPIIKPQEDQVLVKMLASSINPSDLLTIRGTYSNRIAFPKIAGFEGVGIVIETGNSKYNFLLGKRVLAIRGEGTWQEYNLIPAEEIVIVPDVIDNKTAAQLYINPLTIWLMLKLELQIKKGDIVLINAANSSCGHILAGFAKFFKFDLISIVRRPEAKRQLESLGLTKVIDSSNEDLIASINKLTNNQKVDYVLDAVGGDIATKMLEISKFRGKFIQYGLMSGLQLSNNFFKLVVDKEISFKYFHLREWIYNNDDNTRHKLLEKMIENFIKAEIKLPIHSAYDLDNYIEAIKAAESSKRNGKVIFNNEQE